LLRLVVGGDAKLEKRPTSWDGENMAMFFFRHACMIIDQLIISCE
jgi:hypothetical protein